MTDRALPPGGPRLERLTGAFGLALTVDVEEWYHTCLVPAYVHPQRRPPGLAEELDRLLPELAALLAAAGCTATFFFLGEVARRLPARVREIAAAGHEVASHGWLHLRAVERSAADFAADVRDAKALLEDLIGAEVRGFRAPEWSLRRYTSPLLPLVAEAGYRYDSSLAPFPGAGSLANPRWAARLTWAGSERTILEFPPLTLGGPLRVPAGSWTGRLLEPRLAVRAARRHRARGGLPVWTVHPWEVSGRPTPGPLAGLARFLHETGRRNYRERFLHQLGALPWESLWAAYAGAPRAVADLAVAVPEGGVAGTFAAGPSSDRIARG